MVQVARNFLVSLEPTTDIIPSMMDLPSFPPFDLHKDGKIGPRWKKWAEQFERLLVAMDINEPKRQSTRLFHYAGSDVDEIYDTLTVPDPVRVNRALEIYRKGTD